MVTSLPEPPASQPRPTLVGTGIDGAAFLDAPGLDAEGVVDCVERVLTAMPVGCILTVYSDDPTIRAQSAKWCAGRDVELLAVIDHDHDGTTLALRRSGRLGRPAAGDTTGRSTM
jgi:hypothetical protein